MKIIFFATWVAFLWIVNLNAADFLFLRDNLQRAQRGDFLVAAQNKTYNLLHIYDKNPSQIVIEEIMAPMSKLPRQFSSWKEWVKSGAPGHTSWVIYSVDLANGKMHHYYSVSKKTWLDNPQQDHFISTLLNLPFRPVPISQRRRIGLLPTSIEGRALWQPKMYFEGQQIAGVSFDAWTTRWPRDHSELSGKSIEIYLPTEQERYPAYFPYWLQVSNGVGRVSLRIIDSGTSMQSPFKRVSGNS